NRQPISLPVPHFSSRRIHFRSRSAPRGRSEGGKNARARQSGQLARLPDFRSQPNARRISFAVLGTCHFNFSVKIFFCAMKNKVKFFSFCFSRCFFMSCILSWIIGNGSEYIVYIDDN